MNDDDIDGVVLITLSRDNIGSSMSVPVPPDICDMIADTGDVSELYEWAHEEYPDWYIVPDTCKFVEMSDFFDRLLDVGCPLE
tara:strand:+ start:26 stop:274 length:249 start_codon:yes stop_codon:yes gene_type:complete